MRIEFAGQLTKKDFHSMQRLGMGKARYFGWFIIACFAMVLATGGSIHWPADATKLIPIAVLLLMFFIGIPIFISRNWRKNPRVREPVSGVASDDGIFWKSQFSTAEFPWRAFLESRSKKDLVLVYTSPQQVFFFPRHFFSSESDWLVFRQVVKANVAK